MRQKFVKCNTCGNMITFVDEKQMPECCGKVMAEIPYAAEGEAEHIPVVNITGSKIKVSVADGSHPMTDDHYIQWVTMETRTGVQRKNLKPGDELIDILFLVPPTDEIVSSHAYCNVHGLFRDKTREVGRGGSKWGGR